MKKTYSRKLDGADLVTFRNTFSCNNKFSLNDIVSCLGYGPFKVKHILGFGGTKQMNYLLVYEGDVSKLGIATWQAAPEERRYYNISDKDFVQISLEGWMKKWTKEEEKS